MSKADDIRRLIESQKKGSSNLIRRASEFLQNEQKREKSDVSRFIPGEVAQREEGECFISEELFPFQDLYGEYPLSRLSALESLPVLHTFNLLQEESSPGKIFFIDTETTGLAGGTGTYCFMIGIGWIDADGFHVRQLFMRDYDDEPAQLAFFVELLDEAALIVTYNGATFDLPLLKTRLLLNRVRFPLGNIPHLDLLPFGRRLWGKALGSARLSFLEETILKSSREGDIPGAFIPHLYFEFTRGGSPRKMVPVFTHNQKDIVTLAALTERVYSLLTQPELLENEWEILGVGKYFVSCDRCLEARKVFELLTQQTTYSPAWHLACLEQGMLCRRLGDYESAADTWWKLLQNAPFDPIPRIELAKHLEHRRKDFESARQLVLEIFQGYGQSPPESSADAIDDDDNDLFLEELRYDYSEHAPFSPDEFPVIQQDDWDESPLPTRVIKIPLPRWESIREDTVKRYQRILRKLAKYSGG